MTPGLPVAAGARLPVSDGPGPSRWHTSTSIMCMRPQGGGPAARGPSLKLQYKFTKYKGISCEAFFMPILVTIMMSLES